MQNPRANIRRHIDYFEENNATKSISTTKKSIYGTKICLSSGSLLEDQKKSISLVKRTANYKK